MQVPCSASGLMATDEPTPSAVPERPLHCTAHPSLSHRMQVIDRATHAVVVFSFSLFDNRLVTDTVDAVVSSLTNKLIGRWWCGIDAVVFAG